MALSLSCGGADVKLNEGERLHNAFWMDHDSRKDSSRIVSTHFDELQLQCLWIRAIRLKAYFPIIFTYVPIISHQITTLMCICCIRSFSLAPGPLGPPWPPLAPLGPPWPPLAPLGPPWPPWPPLGPLGQRSGVLKEPVKESFGSVCDFCPSLYPFSTWKNEYTYMRVYMYTCIYIYIYISVCVCVSVYIMWVFAVHYWKNSWILYDLLEYPPLSGDVLASFPGRAAAERHSWCELAEGGAEVEGGNRSDAQRGETPGSWRASEIPSGKLT